MTNRPDRDYYRSRVRMSVGDSYKGAQLCKLPEDLLVYQHLIWQTQPEVIVELGTAGGGSALWFADQLRTLTKGADPGIVSVDISRARRPDDPIVEYITADLTEDATLETVKARVGGRRAMVIEDSAHTYVVTKASLEMYSPLVASGCFFVVEDTIVEDEEYCPPDWYDPGTVGRALHEFLPAHPEFTQRHYDMYGLTMHAGGWLERTG